MSQAYLAATLRNLASKLDMMDANQQDLMAFRVTLPNALAEYAPASGQIVGILKQTGDEVTKDLVDTQAAEKAVVVSYEEWMAAKTK